MVRILAALAVATTMLAGASSEASAWVCRAAGLGSGGWARSVNVVDAKIWDHDRMVGMVAEFLRDRGLA